MSEPSRYCCGRRRLAVSAVAFLLPQQQHQLSVHRFLPPTTCSVNPHPSPSSTSTTFGGIQIAPQPPPAAAARSTRRHRHYYGSSGSNSALFAAVVASSEEKERGAGVDKSPNLEEPEEKVGRAKTEQLLPGGYPLGRTAELGRPRRRQRLRSVAVGRTLGRVFGRGRSEEEEQDDDDTKFNSVVAERTEQQTTAANGGGGGGGLLSAFRAWRRQGRRQRRSGSAANGRRIAEKFGGGDRGEAAAAVREGEQERPYESKNAEMNGDASSTAADVCAAAAVAATASAVVTGGDGGVRRGNSGAVRDSRVGSGVVGEELCPGGLAFGGRRDLPYDGEEVLPETWAKVDQLRARAENSDPGAGEAEKGLHIWLATGGGDGREGLTDTDLLRFIMFRHGDVDAAWRQLKRAAAWRLQRRVEAVLSEEQWSRHKELQAEMFWIGRDVEGRPTMVLRSIAHHPGAIDSEDFQRYFLYLLEQGRQLWGLGSVRQLNIVIDRVGAGIKNQDPRLLRAVLPVFRDAYPDIVYRCYVAPSSWIFRFVWIIAARLVDERQRKRVLLLVGDWQSRLLEDFDASVLPLHLGGTMLDYPPQQPPDM